MKNVGESFAIKESCAYGRSNKSVDSMIYKMVFYVCVFTILNHLSLFKLFNTLSDKCNLSVKSCFKISVILKIDNCVLVKLCVFFDD